MGRPKALLPWFGRPMLEHVVDRLAPCVDRLVVVTSRALPIAECLPRLTARTAVRIVVDREPERGPLAALRDGLAAAAADAADLVFATACDAPFLTAQHAEALFARAAAAPSRPVVPVADGFLQVLSGVYPASAWRRAEALLAAGRSSPAALAEALDFAPFAPFADDLAADIAPWTGFNTPEAYLALARRADPAARAEIAWRSAGEAAHAAAGAPRSVAIGRLGEALRASAPSGIDPEAALAAGRLRITFDSGDGSGADAFAEVGADARDLPVGPGDRIRVDVAGPDGSIRLDASG